MSQIVTTKVGRFRHVTPDAWLWECPCGQWSYLTTDQWAGRVSVDHASQGCPVKYHETHNYEAELVVTMQARILTGEPPIDPESPVEPTPEPPTETCAYCDGTGGVGALTCPACEGKPTGAPAPTKNCACGADGCPVCKPAPAPCVWRERTVGHIADCTGGVTLSWRSDWKFCPYCGHPLTVER